MGTATPPGGSEFRQGDASFAGSIPEGYERRLVPLLFEPYAADLRDRIVARAPLRILEVAAGTGAVTREVAAALPGAWIIATDLNQGMIDVAARIVSLPNVQFQQADATSLPFDGASFDLVLAQFGAMFFPDKVAAFREARRVLRPGGAFLFNVWNDVDSNPMDGTIARIYREHTGEICFLERVPFGYHQPDRITSDLREAGFTDIAIEIVNKSTTASSISDAFDAFIKGSPLGGDFEKLDGERALEIRLATIEALTAEFGSGEFTNGMSALVVTAR
jgi:ubiquinone/menaquinone biosynthesis C-methylase UbiE